MAENPRANPNLFSPATIDSLFGDVEYTFFPKPFFDTWTVYAKARAKTAQDPMNGANWKATDLIFATLKNGQYERHRYLDVIKEPEAPTLCFTVDANEGTLEAKKIVGLPFADNAEPIIEFSRGIAVIENYGEVDEVL